MKQPSDLTREQLENIVVQVRDILWLDAISGQLDPERAWDSETIEWVAGAIEDAGLKPDPISPEPMDDTDEPTAAMRSALEAFIDTIEATGGCVRPGAGTDPGDDAETVEFVDDRPVPAGDQEWLDLADAYLLACRALDRAPVIRDADAPIDDD